MLRARQLPMASILVFASTFAAPLHAEERSALASLVAASAQRLELAWMVALAKWDDGAPVEDAAREQQVLDAAIAASVKAGLPARLVTQFFSAQIEANKLIQYSLLTEWQRQGKAPPHAPIDLAKTVRPQIDHLQTVLIEALVKRPSLPSRTWCRAEMTNALEDYIMTHPRPLSCLFTVALERALGPLCDSESA